MLISIKLCPKCVDCIIDHEKSYISTSCKEHLRLPSIVVNQNSVKYVFGLHNDVKCASVIITKHEVFIKACGKQREILLSKNYSDQNFMENWREVITPITDFLLNGNAFATECV